MEIGKTCPSLCAKCKRYDLSSAECLFQRKTLGDTTERFLLFLSRSSNLQFENTAKHRQKGTK